MRNKTILITIVLLVMLGLVLTACGSKAKDTATQPSSPAKVTVAPASGGADGEALMKDRCTKCHSLERVTSAHKSADQWKQTVSKMVSNGAKLTADEQTVLVDYLAKTYAP